ncbi:MAG: hypothetical protein ACT4OD_05325 [Candidatus Nitrosotenuis sp.]
MRRGISTIIGSVFFLVLMTSGLSVSYLVIETQSDMIQAQQTIADSEIKKIQEKYLLSVSSDDTNGNRLAVYVKNQGTNPLQIESIWIINKTQATQPAKKFDVAYTESVLAPGFGTELLQNYPLYMNPGIYDVKTISSIGTMQTTEVNVGGANHIKAKLVMSPPDVRLGENATALLFVTNVGTTRLLNVTAGSITITPSSAVLSSSPIVQMKSDLAPAESTVLSWKYRLLSPAGTNVTFSTFAQGVDEPTRVTMQSNPEKNLVFMRDNSEPGSIVASDLFARPELYLIIPNTFGDTNDSGLWGVNVVNPTDQPVYVSKIVISAQTSPANSNDEVFNVGCNTQSIFPAAVNNWSCPTANQLMWKNTVTSQLIGPKSVTTFLVKVDPGNLGGSGTEPETIIVQANVFTTLGQFGKAAYGTAIRTSSSIANVYLSSVVDSTANANIFANKTKVLPGSTQTFNVVLADLEAAAGNKISAGSRLIINMPGGWTTPVVTGNTGFTIQPPQTFPDGSSQIVGILNEDLTGVGGTGKTISFTSTAPPISDTRMYVMYVLADGYVNGNIVMGPLAEIVLRVSPT